MSEKIAKSNCKPVLVYIPERWIPVMTETVALLDLDRTKFIRHAIREKLTRHGIKASELN